MRLPLLTALVAIVASSIPARANTVTYDIAFTATGQVPASGEYLLTFDPSKTYINATDGLEVVSFSDTFTPPTEIGFIYEYGSLLIGGLASEVNGEAASSNDYILVIEQLTTNPKFGSFTAASTTSSSLFDDYTGTVDVSAPASTPEPSSFALLGTGVLGVAGLLRKRFV